LGDNTSNGNEKKESPRAYRVALQNQVLIRTYRYAGRDFRLTDLAGSVIEEIFTGFGSPQPRRPVL
jgi:hypothetical protein